MLEAIWIFLAYLSMYYFWRSYNTENDIKYAVLSGVFLGLALDTKYNALLLFPSFALFILWSNKRGWFLGWKHLIKRKYLLLFFVSILIFLPVLVVQYMKGVDPFYFNLFGRTGQHSWAGYRTAAGFDILDMLKRGFNNYIDMVVDGHNAAALSLPWLPAFYMAASLLLITTLLYFLYLLFKSQKSGSFLMITFIMLYAFIALFGINYQHYLLWGLPLFFIMLSYLIVVFIEKIGLKIKNHAFSLLDWMKIFTLILACIFTFSYIVMGTIAPSANTWAIGGCEEQVIHIKNEVNPGDCIFTSKLSTVSYYLDKYDFNVEENNIHIFMLYKRTASPGRREGRINLELMKQLKPRFLIIREAGFYRWGSIHEQIVIQENYQKISTVNEIALYERKD
jgi:4-amino-4-deoxy-L-arabinose transferase-like glycosyltransferase